MKRLMAAAAAAALLGSVIFTPVSAGGWKAEITMVSSDPDIGETIVFHVDSGLSRWSVYAACYTKAVFWYKYRIALGESVTYSSPANTDVSVDLLNDGYAGGEVICRAEVWDLTKRSIIQSADTLDFYVDGI